jgi:predicted DNA-binding ribbon-helix-helix protein
MASTIVKRSVLVQGHKTSISLEEPFWNGLKDIAASRRQPLTAVLQQVDLDRQDSSNLSSAVRLFVLEHYRNQAQSAARPENSARLPTAFGSGDLNMRG